MTTTKNRGPKAHPARGTNRRWLLWILAAAALVVILVALYAIFSGSNAPKNTGTGTNYGVGQPGPGQAAPAFTLEDTNGKQVSLGDFKGKNVLLYFQEGLTCQPCWDQLSSLEKDSAKVKAAGVDAVLSITTDPACPQNPGHGPDHPCPVRSQPHGVGEIQCEPVRDDGRHAGRAQLHPRRPGRHHPVAGRLRRRPGLHDVRSGRQAA